MFHIHIPTDCHKLLKLYRIENKFSEFWSQSLKYNCYLTEFPKKVKLMRNKIFNNFSYIYFYYSPLIYHGEYHLRLLRFGY